MIFKLTVAGESRAKWEKCGGVGTVACWPNKRHLISVICPGTSSPA